MEEALPEKKKKCCECGEIKAASEFHKAGKYLCGRCKPCASMYHKAYYMEHRDRRLKGSKRWKEENRERSNEHSRRWRRINHDKWVTARNRNRDRRRGATEVESISRMEILARDGSKCHICGLKVDVNDFHLDHLIPISRGGDHVKENVSVAHPDCNMRRGPGRLPAQLRLLG